MDKIQKKAQKFNDDVTSVIKSPIIRKTIASNIENILLLVKADMIVFNNDECSLNQQNTVSTKDTIRDLTKEDNPNLSNLSDENININAKYYAFIVGILEGKYTSLSQSKKVDKETLYKAFEDYMEKEKIENFNFKASLTKELKKVDAFEVNNDSISIKQCDVKKLKDRLKVKN